MPLLKMRWLGASDVAVHGEPLPPLRYRKDLWLLAYLCLRHDRPVTRQEVSALFWPDSEESQALYSLRRSLSNLRRALGPEAHRLLTPTPSTLRLDLSGADCDLLAFDAAVARGGDSQAALQQAVELYRGPLLPGCLDEWAHAERNAREQSYLAALERLARITQEKGDPVATVRWLRLLLAADPFRESACRHLMQALADCGDMAAVTHVYQELRLLIRRDLNAAPPRKPPRSTEACST
jgi:DNA-binding SARP family transcriptional activator